MLCYVMLCYVMLGNVNDSTSISSLSEQTIEKPCHFPVKLPSKPEIILRWQLTFQMGVWRQISLTFSINFSIRFLLPRFIIVISWHRACTPVPVQACATLFRKTNPYVAISTSQWATSWYSFSFLYNKKIAKRKT